MATRHRALQGFPPAPAAPSGRPARTRCRGRELIVLRVLLVEDDPGIALLAASVLEAAGHRVTVAADGLEGLQGALQEPPDLVISDFMMPRLTGLEMIERLREAGFRRPIILATAIAEDGLPSHPGWNAYLAKPYGARELLALVEAFRTDTNP
jgi:CheY-like chemotaxis protein